MRGRNKNIEIWNLSL